MTDARLVQRTEIATALFRIWADKFDSELTNNSYMEEKLRECKEKLVINVI